MSTITVKNLNTHTILGIHDWEQQLRPIIINITITLNTEKAEHSDNIEDTLNYDTLITDIDTYCKKTKTKLIEHLAHNIMQHIIEHYTIDSITIEIDKPGVHPSVDSVSVTLKKT